MTYELKINCTHILLLSYKTKYLNDKTFHNFCAMRAVESTKFHKLLTLSLNI